MNALSKFQTILEAFKRKYKRIGNIAKQDNRESAMKRDQRAGSVCCDSTAPRLEDCTGWIRADRLTHCIVLQRFRFRCHGIASGCVSPYRSAESVRFSPGVGVSVRCPCWQTAQGVRGKQSLPQSDKAVFAYGKQSQAGQNDMERVQQTKPN